MRYTQTAITKTAYITGTLAVLFLIGSFVTSASAQDGWRAARKTEQPQTEHRTKVSAPVRLASYQKEIPLDELDAKSGPVTRDLKTAQLKVPVQVETQPGVTVSNGESITTYMGTTPVQSTPQTVYYPQDSALTSPGYTASNCGCSPQQGYTAYYAPAGSTTFAPATGTSYTSWRPLLNLTPAPQEQFIGQGIFGQPKVYVPGQPILNTLRYISP